MTDFITRTSTQASPSSQRLSRGNDCRVWICSPGQQQSTPRKNARAAFWAATGGLLQLLTDVASALSSTSNLLTWPPVLVGIGTGLEAWQGKATQSNARQRKSKARHGGKMQINLFATRNPRIRRPAPPSESIEYLDPSVERSVCAGMGPDMLPVRCDSARRSGALPERIRAA